MNSSIAKLDLVIGAFGPLPGELRRLRQSRHQNRLSGSLESALFAAADNRAAPSENCCSSAFTSSSCESNADVLATTVELTKTARKKKKTKTKNKTRRAKQTARHSSDGDNDKDFDKSSCARAPAAYQSERLVGSGHRRRSLNDDSLAANGALFGFSDTIAAIKQQASNQICGCARKPPLTACKRHSLRPQLEGAEVTQSELEDEDSSIASSDEAAIGGLSLPAAPLSARRLSDGRRCASATDSSTVPAASVCWRAPAPFKSSVRQAQPQTAGKRCQFYPSSPLPPKACQKLSQQQLSLLAQNNNSTNAATQSLSAAKQSSSFRNHNNNKSDDTHALTKTRYEYPAKLALEKPNFSNQTQIKQQAVVFRRDARLDAGKSSKLRDTSCKLLAVSTESGLYADHMLFNKLESIERSSATTKFAHLALGYNERRSPRASSQTTQANRNRDQKEEGPAAVASKEKAAEGAESEGDHEMVTNERCSFGKRKMRATSTSSTLSSCCNQSSLSSATNNNALADKSCQCLAQLSNSIVKKEAEGREEQEQEQEQEAERGEENQSSCQDAASIICDTTTQEPPSILLTAAPMLGQDSPLVTASVGRCDAEYDGYDRDSAGNQDDTRIEQEMLETRIDMLHASNDCCLSLQMHPSVLPASAQKRQPQQAGASYPNNTVLADLSRCHRSIASAWPTLVRKNVQSLRAAKKGSSNKSSGGTVALDNSNAMQQSVTPVTPATDDNNNHSNQLQKQQQQQQQPQASKESSNKRAFQMPDALRRAKLSLSLDDYDKAVGRLTSDPRYKLHMLLYRRVQTIWILTTTICCALLPITFTITLSQTILATLMLLAWLASQGLGFAVTRSIRSKLNTMLESCVARVNALLITHNLILGVINDGGLFSKTRLAIPLLYFETQACQEQIESIIDNDAKKNADGSTSANLDYARLGFDRPSTASAPDCAIATVIDISNSNNRIEDGSEASSSPAASLAAKVVLRFSQRWISLFHKHKLAFSEKTSPRHLSTGKCLCQFIEEHFKPMIERCENEEARKSSCGNANRIQATPDSYVVAATTTTTTTTASRYKKSHDEQQHTTVMSSNGINNNKLVPVITEIVDSKKKKRKQQNKSKKSDKKTASNKSAPTLRFYNGFETTYLQLPSLLLDSTGRPTLDSYSMASSSSASSSSTSTSPSTSSSSSSSASLSSSSSVASATSTSSPSSLQSINSDSMDEDLQSLAARNNGKLLASDANVGDSCDVNRGLDSSNDSGIVVNSGDLVAKLRSLLESRKDHLGALDKALFAGLLCSTDKQFALNNTFSPFFEHHIDDQSQNQNPDDDEINLRNKELSTDSLSDDFYPATATEKTAADVATATQLKATADAPTSQSTPTTPNQKHQNYFVHYLNANGSNKRPPSNQQSHRTNATTPTRLRFVETY